MSIKQLKPIDVVLIVEFIVLAVVLVLVLKPAPCHESLDLYPNLPDHGNFGQRILTEHNCRPGQLPVNWRSFP